MASRVGIIRLDTSDPANRQWSCGVTHPPAVLSCDRRTREATLCAGETIVRTWTDPLAALDALPRLRPDGTETDTRDGARWVGFLSYDLGRLFEALPDAPPEDPELPLFSFAFVPAGAIPPPLEPMTEPRSAEDGPRSSFDQRAYEAAVRRVIDYIAAGDVFQVNLAQRFAVRLRDAPAEIYTRLQRRHPARYAGFLDFGRFQLISNSPELFIAVDGPSRKITNRPIKGTRPNAPGMRAELLHSAKDRAELAMIVDLQRNDLGRVCEVGSVRVACARQIEEHPTVLHGVATVEGRLRADVTLSRLLAAVFPCGSITGCPKIRAMQIIDELEPVARGAYCGAIGWVGHDGSMQFNVAIRTMTAAGGRVFMPVGGGIVADSSPRAEYEETLVKARAMFEAAGVRAPATIAEARLGG